MTRTRHTAFKSLLGRIVVSTVAFLAFAAIATSSAVRADTHQKAAFSLGVDLDTGLYETGAVTSFEAKVRAHADIVQSFVSWEYVANPSFSEFPTSHVDAILNAGSIPEITWDPSINGDSSLNQPQLSLASIADGDYDSYITQFADAAKSVGQPIMIRFAHEMNGPWTSYYEGNSGNQPGDFVKAWRHIHDLFEQAGATNVEWVWSPNAVEAGDHSLQSLYPGDGYVDWVGVDGYSYPLAGCEPASVVFGQAVREIRRFTAKPMMLAEVGISANCSRKPALISDLFTWLKRQPEIQSITWWERTASRNNYSVDSSSASLAAFTSGLRGLIASRSVPYRSTTR